MVVDGRFQDGTSLVKEGVVFLKGGDIGRTLPSEGDRDKGGSSEF